MAQELNLKIAGLYTSPNELSSVPQGALLKATNIDILKDNIAEPRRGFGRLAVGYSNTAHRTDATWFYQAKQFAHHGTLGSAANISYFNAGAWTSVGSYSAPSSSTKIKTINSNQNLFFTSSAGIKKLDAYNGSVRQAGAYKGLDIDAALNAAGAGFLAINYRVAYRVVFGYEDANENLILGAPSGRTSIKNTGATTKDVDLTFTIPAGVTTSWFYQVYRSAQIDNSASEIEPNDELQLVYESNPTAGQITAGYVTVTDITPDELRAALIYTAATQEGIAFQNEAPPMSEDMCLFRNCVFYSNTTSKHRFSLTLIAVGGTAGLVADDTITIGGIAYTAKATETIASAQFKVFTAGSASQNIRDTAYSLVKVINRHTSSTVNAYYISGSDELPGKILIEERSIGGAAFAVTTSRATCWNPTDIPTSGTASSSSNDRFMNGLMWSKPFQPEAVPIVNSTRVGSEDSEIYRIIPLREAVYIFKADGIYRLTGIYPSFDVELLDSSAKLIGRETPAVLNNQIYCLTDQGVSVVTDGVQVISRQIEDSIRTLFAADLDVIRLLSFGISYETERKYHLFLVDNVADTNAQYSYVYNVFTNAWTKHTVSATCGVVYENNLYLGDDASNYILKDKKSFNYLDYADFGYATSITSVSGTTLGIAAGTDNISVGDVIYQSDSLFGIVQSINSIASTVVVDGEPGFTVAACDVLRAIATEIEWCPVDVDNSGILKQMHTVIFIFKYDYNGTAYLTTKTDVSPDQEETPITGLGSSLWGLFFWGEARWGGQNLKRPLRQWIPRDKQYSTQLTVGFKHTWGYSPWELQGVTVFGETGSEKVGR